MSSSKGKWHLYGQSKNFSKGKFVNQIPTLMDTGVRTTLSILRDFMKGNPNGKPAGRVPVQPMDARLIQRDDQARLTWFGHSAVLLELGGKTILLDPMLGKAPSPVPLFGSKRYSEKLPVEVEELPPIDAVLLSHDHYDHLDYGTIKKLKNKARQFFVPLGVGRHLKRWGIDESQIEEHDWWDEFEFEGLTLACTPARHFSGRGLTDRNATLWCSWVILAGEHKKVYFSGDSGYGPHFAEIGEKYGPFDMTLMECGQYDERWSAIHMMPEETVQAHIDVKGKIMIPIHWSAFTLALHDWTDPIERVTKAAQEHDISISTPRIGETVTIGSVIYPASAWWR
ncbi:MBL fold metallo-hydrolase [Paenibacillus abyssi]|uniref:Membrane protein n=1 Tax=Paenibacillus abyssi TaxID=1340531 RepID=A0A917FPN5_9BACL|nr:MBL fold metallo-hydrolase [Paenibacillus abyssi]GGF93667.1 membrane protein [Paenibacillus abyssi]